MAVIKFFYSHLESVQELQCVEERGKLVIGLLMDVGWERSGYGEPTAPPRLTVHFDNPLLFTDTTATLYGLNVDPARTLDYCRNVAVLMEVNLRPELANLGREEMRERLRSEGLRLIAPGQESESEMIRHL